MREMLERRKAQQRERIERARRYMEAVRKELGKVTAWVYGSVARGTFKAWSDTDVFIVAERLPDHPLQRNDLLYRFVDSGVEPKAWTKEEFLKALLKGDGQILAMLRDRILLADELSLEPLLEEAEQRTSLKMGG